MAMRNSKVFTVVAALFCFLATAACSHQSAEIPTRDINRCAKQPKDVLACYIASSEKTPPPILLGAKTLQGVKVYRYRFVSQTWPLPAMSRTAERWQHTLTLYIPPQVRSKETLLIAEGGTRNSSGLFSKNTPRFSMELDYPALAQSISAIVVRLEDVPNQYLTFDDGVPRREDSIVAYSWKRYLKDPQRGNYWPIHLPMAKAIVRAMDAVQ